MPEPEIPDSHPDLADMPKWSDCRHDGCDVNPECSADIGNADSDAESYIGQSSVLDCFSECSDDGNVLQEELPADTPEPPVVTNSFSPLGLGDVPEPPIAMEPRKSKRQLMSAYSKCDGGCGDLADHGHLIRKCCGVGLSSSVEVVDGSGETSHMQVYIKEASKEEEKTISNNKKSKQK